MSATNTPITRINKFEIEIRPNEYRYNRTATDLDKAKELCCKGRFAFKAYDHQNRPLNRLARLRYDHTDSRYGSYDYWGRMSYNSPEEPNVKSLCVLLRLRPAIVENTVVLYTNIVCQYEDNIQYNISKTIKSFTFETGKPETELGNTRLNAGFWFHIRPQYRRYSVETEELKAIELIKGEYRNEIFVQKSHINALMSVMDFSKLLSLNNRPTGQQLTEIYYDSGNGYASIITTDGVERLWDLETPIRIEMIDERTHRYSGYKEFTLLNRSQVAVITTQYRSDLFTHEQNQRPQGILHPDLESDNDENVVNLDDEKSQPVQQPQPVQRPVQQPQRRLNIGDFINLAKERCRNVVLDDSNSTVIRLITPECYIQILRELSANAITDEDVSIIASQIRIYFNQNVISHIHNLEEAVEPDVIRLLTEFKNRNKKFKMIPRHLYDALYKEGAECSVCMDNMTREKFEMTHCGHQICRDCLYQLNNYQCPTCKCDINGE